MSNHIYNINKGIIIQHVKDTSNDYVENLYNSLDDSIKSNISIDDIQQKLIKNMLSIVETNSLPDCFEILDKWIVFGGKDFDKFLADFISSFDNVNLKNGLGKDLINICEYYHLL